jgi:hydrogenase maturation protease
MRFLVLVLGNLLWADEGFGVRAVEAMARRYRFPANVTLLDGGTQGLYLVDRVRDADVLVVLDAIDYGLPPATLKLVEGQAVPRFMGAKKMSLHQTGFQEVLSLAQLMGGLPPHLLLIGVQPRELEHYGGSLRPEIKAQIAPAIDAALSYLRRFGIEPEHRGVDALPRFMQTELAMDRYEAGRPGAGQACRTGDDRILARVTRCGDED